MAKKSNRNSRRSRGMRKLQPSEMTITIAGPSTSSGSTEDYYLDLSQVASLVNRRFYRQGINWAVAGFKFLVASGTAGSVTVSRLPNTWVMSNAWEKGMRSWNEMNKEALAESESVRGRFLDFKIYADSTHHDKGMGANLLPAGYFAGEWIPSEIRVPNSIVNNTTSGFELIATGDNYPGASTATGKNAVSLIQGYANSRALPSITDPNSPGEATDAGPSATPENWLSALHNDGVSQDSDVLNDVTAYDEPPYPFENGIDANQFLPGTTTPNPNFGLPYTDTMYPGGQTQAPGLVIHDFVTYSATTVGGQARGKGGNFPCGLIKFSHNVPSGTAHNVVIQLDMVPGPHRGYMCQDMKDM